VVRHAQAKQATVKVTRARDTVELLVQDDGRGMNLERTRKGTGLTGIRERAHLFAGSMSLESQLGKGTTLRIKFQTSPEVSP
jgi:signal transduction histidine kinase